MPKGVWRFFIVPGLAMLLAAGCGGDGGSSSTGRLDLGVTDAAVDNAEEFVVTFVSASLQGLDGASVLGTVPVPEDNQTVDLLAYQGNNHAMLVTGLEVPAGTYKLRLDADLTFGEDEQRSWIAFDENSPECLEAPQGVIWSGSLCLYPLEIPSGEESGFKPKGEITIAAGGTSSFTVEFDLRKNVTDPQNDEFYKLKPTGLRLVDDTLAGSIAGIVDADFIDSECDTSQAIVYLFDGAGVDPDDIHPDNEEYVTSTPVREETLEDVTSYSYLIGFVMPGEYTVALTCGDDDPELDEGISFPAIADSVTVISGEETIQNLPVPE